MIEGEPRFERPRTRAIESQRLVRNPEEAFDSDLPSAEAEFQMTMEDMRRAGEGGIKTCELEFSFGAETGGSRPIIQFIWPGTRNTFTFLHLNPIAEGYGFEGGIIGYSGTYGSGIKRRPDNNWQVLRSIPLENLLQTPDNIQLVVKPTVDRWAIGIDYTAMVMGENFRTLYMGLGFLFLGQEWMHIGFHESGHLPHNDDENHAWQIANRHYAQIHRGQRAAISKGENLGLFDLLKKETDLFHPSIGTIMKYGLITHYKAGNASIPRVWRKDGNRTLKEFTVIIESAQDHYQAVFSS
jgi:hypothetical protein